MGLKDILDSLYGPSTPRETAPVSIPVKAEDVAPIPEIKGFRADPTNKSGGKDGLETMPTKFNPAVMGEYVKAMAIGKKYGVPQMDAKELAALALKEGGSAFGLDPVSVFDKDGNMTDLLPYDPNMKGDKELFDRLKSNNLTDYAAGFAVRLTNKHNQSKRLNKPMAELWNGTGVGENNQTGADYAVSIKDFISAAGHKKNSGLVKFIQGVIDSHKDENV